MGFHKLKASIVIQQPERLALIFDRVQWGTGNIHVTLLDEVTKFLVKEREQQALNVQAVYIGISGDDDTMKLQAADVK